MEIAEFDRPPELLLIFGDDWTQELLVSLYNFLLKTRFKAPLKIIVFWQHLTVDEVILVQTAVTFYNMVNVIYIRIV